MATPVTNSVQIVLGAKGISATSRALNDLSKATVGFGAALTAIAAPVAKFGQILGTIAAGLGAGALTATIAGLNDIINLAGELSDESARTGIGIAPLLELREAFKAVGLGAEQVADSVAKMQQRIGEAADGGLAAQAKFEILGLNFQELQALDPGAQFEAIGKAIGQIEDPAIRAARAVDVFGKSGSKLLPVFGDTGGLAKAQARLGEFPAIMARIAPTLDEVGDILDTFPAKLRGFFAGLAEPLAPTLLEFVRRFETLDLSRAGQIVGAFIKLVIEAFRKGNLTEILGLTFEAGMELGEAAFYRFFNEMLRLLGGPDLGQALTAGFIEAFRLSAIAVNKIQSVAATFIAAYLLHVIDQARFLLESLWQGMKKGFAEAVNYLIDGLNNVITQTRTFIQLWTGITINPISPIVVDSVPIAAVKTLQETLASLEKDKQAAAQLYAAQLSGVVALLKEALSLEVKTADETGKRLSATAKLWALIQKMLAASLAVSNATKSSGQTETEPAVPFNLQNDQLALKNQLFKLEQERAKLDADFSKTAAEKQVERIDLLKKEQALLLDNAQALQVRAEATLDPVEAQRLQNEAQQNRQQAGGLGNEVLRQGPSLTSVGDQLIATITQARDQIGTIAQQIGQVLTKTIGGAIDAIAGGIEGLIEGTLTWSQALAQVGKAILSSIIKAVAQMIAQMLVQATLSVVTAAITGKAILKAMAPAAVASSIASYGAAAVAGTAAFAAAMTTAETFQSGGYTGAGGRNQPAGIVHRGEYVLPASAVRAIGLPEIEAFRMDPSAFADPQAPTAAPTINNDVNVYAFNSYGDAMKRWMESSEGRAVFVDMTRKTQHLVTR